MQFKIKVIISKQNVIQFYSEIKVEAFQCMDTEDIITPINVDVLEDLLLEIRYDKEKTSKFINGFQQGFDLGYQGNMKRKNTARNLPFHIGDSFEMWMKIMKEVKEHRYVTWSVSGPAR